MQGIVRGINIEKKLAAEFKGAQVLHDGFYGAERVKPIYNMPSNIFESIKMGIDAVIKVTEDIKTKTTEGINAINH